MKKTHETGNVKNVANLEDLISFCEGYATAYQPSNASIQLAALQAVLMEARSKITAVNTAATEYNNATNERVMLFQPLRKFSTRIVNALEATGAAKLTVANARAIVRKIHGTKAHKDKHAEAPLVPVEGIIPAPAAKVISAAQTSYDSLTEHFARLVNHLQAEPLYTPNEADLKAAALDTLFTTMNTANTAVINKATALSNARMARNHFLYDSNTGVHHLVQEVKKYIKSVFGATSPEYRQVSKIMFTKVRI
ncbi:MAG: hypothetical protein ABI199_02460 [Bacteroidia bacterium]